MIFYKALHKSKSNERAKRPIVFLSQQRDGLENVDLGILLSINKSVSGVVRNAVGDACFIAYSSEWRAINDADYERSWSWLQICNNTEPFSQSTYIHGRNCRNPIVFYDNYSHKSWHQQGASVGSCKCRICFQWLVLVSCVTPLTAMSSLLVF